MSRFGGRLRGTTAVSQWLGSGGGRVVRVQRGTITMAGALTGTATIDAVDPQQSLLVYLGEEHNAVEPNNSRRRSRIAFTNSTTITATRSDAGGTQVVAFEVRTYTSGTFKQIQRGTVATTDTIQGVNTDKAIVSMLGFSTTQLDGDAGIRITLTNATTVTATQDGNCTAGYEVAEYN